jgi:hypothetical protein
MSLDMICILQPRIPLSCFVRDDFSHLLHTSIPTVPSSRENGRRKFGVLGCAKDFLWGTWISPRPLKRKTQLKVEKFGCGVNSCAWSSGDPQ